MSFNVQKSSGTTIFRHALSLPSFEHFMASELRLQKVALNFFYSNMEKFSLEKVHVTSDINFYCLSSYRQYMYMYSSYEAINMQEF